ncbi:tryptophan halogenase family protein [Pseudomarimonas arenosa]|uniref:Tryptophan 7-halogenase n=1 Tax=Pseudomarimonas arenosa TaxID=2774145 RepID=A0AAW3ZNP8_9GAMM|nr:tryptophan halogenase family protein [Pseudomarimonas arenosa]MBD8526259.1 tryptophan 7-halogenase [Pseudomarimonas arenosa]
MPIATQGPTATVYNQYRSPLPPSELPAATGIRRIAVVGGGSAGWMSALLLADALKGSPVEVHVLESPTVETIGVGEGSTPWLRGFFDQLGIEEAEWMPACHATYKCGISFEGWSRKPGFERYFHPFASMLDNLTLTQFVHNVHQRLRGADVYAHPDRFFVAAQLAEQGKAPRPRQSFPFDIWYGYHFDAVLLGKFLHLKAVERGVQYRQCHVEAVERHDTGDLAALLMKDGQRFEADLFVDCTGFAAVLIQKTLNTPFISFKNNLFNDAAVALPTPIGDQLPSQTRSIAMRHGWRWEIPLTQRYGNGYVYSSAYCSAEQAERELRESLGLLDDPTEARHLKMRIGRLSEHWNRNCLAVGLSQGFIEPLEATALLFIQRTVQMFCEQLRRGDLSEQARTEFNRRSNEHFEGTRDYIVSHYKTNSRGDTPYWRDCAANGELSDALKELYTLWLSGKGIAEEVGSQRLGKGYPVFSWYCLLAGMGCFPPELRPANSNEQYYDLREIDDFVRRSAENFPSQRELLAAPPRRRVDPSLQIYFW